MNNGPEKILIIDRNTPSRRRLEDLLRNAGYEVLATDFCQEGLESVRNDKPDLLLLDANLPGIICRDLLLELKGASTTAETRVILLESEGPDQRGRDLDLGADDVLPRPWDPIELLARVRHQLRAKTAQDGLRKRTILAENGEELTRTAFQTLAVTEKMSRDAFSLARALKAGLATLFIIVAIMAVIYFCFLRRAAVERQRTDAVIARLNRGLTRQEDLIAQSRKISEKIQSLAADGRQTKQQQLEQHCRELRAQIAGAPSGQAAATLRSQLQKTEARLRQVESEASVAQGIIRAYAPSVCLIHLTMEFRERSSQRRLRYAGLTSDGEPILDSNGDPAVTLEGTGPEVVAQILGTGFLSGNDGQVLTNHHVVEPWWNNDDSSSLTKQGVQPVITRMEAYFPGSPHAFQAVTAKISPQADLAVVKVDLGNLKRQVLDLDVDGDAAVSGQAVVLMGYPTGVDAILARASESTVREIVNLSQGNLSNILAELAQRSLIRPVVTQGHIGDVLPDKIIYDAQTTSGGSGGPLFNQQGRVIGINYGVVRDFGGSNFGIPGRYAKALLAQ